MYSYTHGPLRPMGRGDALVESMATGESWVRIPH